MTADNSRVIEEWWTVLGGPDLPEGDGQRELRSLLAHALRHAFHAQIPESPHAPDAALEYLAAEAPDGEAAAVAQVIRGGALQALRSPQPSHARSHLTAEGARNVVGLLTPDKNAMAGSDDEDAAVGGLIPGPSG